MKKERWKIYVIFRKSDYKMYVGQSKNISARMATHKSDSQSKSMIDRSIQKHGWDAHRIMIVDVADNRKDAGNKESFWIQIIGTQYPNGFNLTTGGDGIDGYKHTDEWKKEASIRMKGEGNHMYGKKGPLCPSYGIIRSEEYKMKMSIAKKGERRTDEHKKKYSECKMGIKSPSYKGKVKNMDTGQVYNTTKEAAEAVNRSRTSIYEVLNGHKQTCAGFRWIRLGVETEGACA